MRKMFFYMSILLSTAVFPALLLAQDSADFKAMYLKRVTRMEKALNRSVDLENFQIEKQYLKHSIQDVWGTKGIEDQDLSSKEKVSLTRVSSLKASLGRIEENFLWMKLESLSAPTKWVLLWDSAVESERLQKTLAQSSSASPWNDLLMSSRGKVEIENMLLSVSSEKQTFQHWIDQQKQIIQAESSEEKQVPLIWSMLLREGIESMVVLFCLLAGLKQLARKQIIFGAVSGLAVSLLFYQFLKTLIHATPHAEWIRYFVLINCIVSMSILLFATNFNFHSSYWSRWISGLKNLKWHHWALFFAGFFAVFREGAELSLALSFFSLESGEAPILSALAGVLPIWALFAFLLFGYKWTTGLRKILIITGGLMILVSITFSQFAVRLLQSFDWISMTPYVDNPYAWLQNWFAYNGSLESTVTAAFMAGILLQPILKSIKLRIFSTSVIPKIQIPKRS